MKFGFLFFFFITIVSCGSNNRLKHHFSNVQIKQTNGKEIMVKMEFPIFLNQKNIYYRTLNNKSEKIKITDVSEVIYNLPNDKIKFTKLQINGGEISPKIENVQFLQVITQGRIKLYRGYNTGFIYKNNRQKFIRKTDLYFCNTKDKPELTLIYFADNDSSNDSQMKQKVLKYFASENLLAESLEKHEFTPENFIQQIINYNNKYE